MIFEKIYSYSAYTALKAKPSTEVSKSIAEIFNRPSNMTQAPDANGACFYGAPVFALGDSNHQTLLSFLRNLYTEGDHHYEKHTHEVGIHILGGYLNRTKEYLGSAPQSQVYSNLPSCLQHVNRLIVCDDFNEFPLLKYAAQSIKAAAAQLNKDEGDNIIQALDATKPSGFYIALTKGSQVAKPHDDAGFLAVWSLSAPSLTHIPNESVHQQTTRYETLNGSLKHHPLGVPNVMFPDTKPLVHTAPELDPENHQEVEGARMYIAVGLLAQQKIKPYADMLKCAGIADSL